MKSLPHSFEWGFLFCEKNVCSLAEFTCRERDNSRQAGFD